jgi:hypothetical protein
MEYGIIGLVILVLDIIAIINIIQSGLEPLMKLVWVILVLALPVIGMVLWFLIGSKKAV